MTTAVFTECLRALDASTGVQGDILLYANNCAFCRQDISLLQNVKYVHYTPLYLS
jgi:hypothetical protein